jgi:hypothetical protein
VFRIGDDILLNDIRTLMATRVMIDSDPFASNYSDAPGTGRRGIWPASWVTESAVPDPQFHVTAYRLRFTLAAAATLRLHVTADERYELYIDGEYVGRGSERGDERNWFFETYDAPLAAGEHVIVARTWWLGPHAPAAYAQHSVRPGFLLAAQGEGISPELANTGKAAWEFKRLGGYETRPHGDAWGAGAKLRLIGERIDWDFPHGSGEGWQAAHKADNAQTATSQDSGTSPWLRPAVLPPMYDAPRQDVVARHVAAPESLADAYKTPIHAADSLPGEVEAWNALLAAGKAVTVPPRSFRRVIIDAGTYVCAYPHLRTSGGRGATVRLFWMESLTDTLPGQKEWIHAQRKGDRAAVEGKFFWGAPYGVGDEFLTDGGTNRALTTLWWEAGRYVEVTIETADEPLTIDAFELRETHYPYDFTAAFDASEPRLARVGEIALRTLEMCSHETYMDCPYFEQLQYIGDTRLQALVAYVSTPDARLPKKAIEMFDASRDPSGLTQSRYPSSRFQRIAPFSLWWVGMVHDHAMWRDDPAFVRARLPGVRAVLDAYAQHVTADGVLGPVPGWNYVDWVRAWPSGMPPGAADGVSAPLCWQYALALRQAAELEDEIGEPEIAALQRRRATALAMATVERFYIRQRGLFADDLDYTSFSEHAQCLSLLSGLLPSDVATSVAAALTSLPDLHRTTIYFSHYKFEALRQIGRTDLILANMDTWYELLDHHLSTTVEMPEPTRSDCHAWGAHPLFHFHATLAGVRPAVPGFAKVEIRPQPGGLTWLRANTVHPRGHVQVELRKDGVHWHGEVSLPDGVSGELVTRKSVIPLTGGRQQMKDLVL